MNMREKIAKAIAVSDGWREPFTWHAQQEAVYYKRADAVLDALMEPTKEMIVEGNYAIDEHIDFYNYDSGAGYSVESTAATACLVAMLNVAKGEATP